MTAAENVRDIIRGENPETDPPEGAHVDFRIAKPFTAEAIQRDRSPAAARRYAALTT